MKAYLIDPVNKTITEVDYTGDYTNIYEHIQARCFDVLRLDKGDLVYVDDEGLMNGTVQRFGWHMFTAPDGSMRPLAGYGLVLGSDVEGDSVEPSISLEDLRAMVSFPTHAEVMQLAAENSI